MNGVILDLKPVLVRVRPRKPVQARVLDINDPSAIHADEMMMLADVWVEASRRARMTGLLDQAKRDKRAQNAMNRHARNLRKLSADGAIKLFGCRMIAPVQDRLKNSLALGCDRRTAIAMRGEKPIHPLFFNSRTHIAG